LAVLHDELAPARLAAGFQPCVAAAQRRVARETQLAAGREDANAVVGRVALRRQQEGRLRQVGPAREVLHLLVRQARAIQHHRERVAAIRRAAENIDLLEIALLQHRFTPRRGSRPPAPLFPYRSAARSPSRTTGGGSAYPAGRHKTARPARRRRPCPPLWATARSRSRPAAGAPTGTSRHRAYSTARPGPSSPVSARPSSHRVATCKVRGWWARGDRGIRPSSP